MRVAVCDDENNDLNCALDLLKEYDTAGALELFPFSETESLVASAATEPFDLVILDIEMPHMNGYEAAQKLVRMPDKPLVIFLTNSMDYSLRGYGLVFRYLSKPLDKSLFYTAMDAARQEIQAHRFVFVLENESHIVTTEDIYYLEVLNHHTILHTMDREYAFRSTLHESLSQLPAGFFGMPHKSYVVNFMHIKTATSREIHLTNGVRIPVSRYKQHEFEAQLHRYLGR